MTSPRPLLAAACIVLGASLLLAGALLRDAAKLLRPDAFADRVAASLADPRVAAFAAERLTEAVIAQNRDLTGFRPLILAASRDVVASRAFRGVTRAAARRAHAAAFSRVGRSVVLSVPDVEVVLRGALAGAPAVAARIPPSVRLGVATVGRSPALRAALDAAESGLALARFGAPALAAGTLLVALGVLLMPDRRDALVGAGAALIAIGGALWLLVSVGQAVIARTADDPAARAALAGAWEVGLAGVPGWGLMYGGIGVVLAAAGSSLLERLDPGALGRRVRHLVTRAPRRQSLRLLRGALLAGAGAAAVVAPTAALSAAAIVAGLAVAFVGLRELFAAVLHATPAHVRLRRAVAESGEGWAVGGALVVLLAAAFAAAIALTRRTAAAGDAPTTIDACNGAAALCDRRLDEVVFAGTHNAMASADIPAWLFPHQERGIATQLADGVRALLVDAHYGTPVGARVKTDLADGASDAMRARAERVLGPEGVAAAMRVRDRLVDDGAAAGSAARGVYFCHGFCELGAVPADSALGAVRDFLVQHPNEVVLLVVEDYVAPRDLAAAFERSGLAAFAYRGGGAGWPLGDRRWPTLRELIARDERAVVFVESGRGGVPWLLAAFDAMQETPYTFAAARDTLSCAPNRGGTAGALFQVNHWIETPPAPRPSNAAVTNSYAALLERARRCERARGRRPNIFAVDFYRTGDVLRAVRELNGVQP